MHRNFVFRYLDVRKVSTVYLPSDQPMGTKPFTRPAPAVRFQLAAPLRDDGGSAVVMAYLSRERCLEACQSLDLPKVARPVAMSVEEAMHVAKTMYRVPLLVELSSYCDVDTREESCDVFYARVLSSSSSNDSNGTVSFFLD